MSTVVVLAMHLSVVERTRVRRQTTDTESEAIMADRTEQTIKTQASTSGFIVGDLRLQQTKDGTPMLTARVGQEQFEADGQGGFIQLDNHYFNIVQYGKSAERSFSQFKSGDRFVAEGFVRDFEYENREGQTIEGKEFVVKKVGHDTARTRYEVDRTPRQPGAEREGAAPSAERGIEQDAPDAEPAPAPEPAAEQAGKSRSPRSRKLATIPSSGVASSSSSREPVGADVPF